MFKISDIHENLNIRIIILILAIESATPVCSVCLYCPQSQQKWERWELGRGVHSTKLILFVRQVLEEANVQLSAVKAVVVSNGPGSFTGLRIASSAIRGLFFQSDIPIVSLPTTLCIAASAIGLGQAKTVHACVDARRQHLYHQSFKLTDGLLSPTKEPTLEKLDDLAQRIEETDIVLGTGLQRIPWHAANSPVLPENELSDIHALNMIAWLKTQAKDESLIHYIIKIGHKVDELKITYSLD